VITRTPGTVHRFEVQDRTRGRRLFGRQGTAGHVAGVTLECSLEDALKVAGELYARGFDVRLLHHRRASRRQPVFRVSDQPPALLRVTPP